MTKTNANIIESSALSALAMSCGQEKRTDTVIDGQTVRHWVGFGWVSEGSPSAEQRATLPHVVRGPDPADDPQRYDFLTREHTAFKCFQDLIDAFGGYAPSLRAESARACRMASGRRINQKGHRAELTELADGYDRAQAQRGDARRAFRS